MVSVALADAKARLSELIDLVERGEAVSITRRGKPVARLIADEGAQQAYRPIDLAKLERFAVTMPRQDEDAASFVRGLRDGYRY